MAQDWSTESLGKEIRRVVDETPHVTRLESVGTFVATAAGGATRP